MNNDDVEQCLLPWKHDPSAESFPDYAMSWANHVIAGNVSCILIIQLIFFLVPFGCCICASEIRFVVLEKLLLGLIRSTSIG